MAGGGVWAALWCHRARCSGSISSRCAPHTGSDQCVGDVWCTGRRIYHMDGCREIFSRLQTVLRVVTIHFSVHQKHQACDSVGISQGTSLLMWEESPCTEWFLSNGPCSGCQALQCSGVTGPVVWTGPSVSSGLESRGRPNPAGRASQGHLGCSSLGGVAELVQTVTAVLTGSLGLTSLCRLRTLGFPTCTRRTSSCKRSVGAHSTLLLKLSMGDLTEARGKQLAWCVRWGAWGKELN